MQNRFPLAIPQVALEVMAANFPPAALREGQGRMRGWDGVEGSCEGLLTPGAASKDKWFSGSTNCLVMRTAW